MDAADCKTVYLSGSFLREIYDGQLFVKLKNGFDFPAMDPWGTSDPYVVMHLDNQVVKSKVKWGTKTPNWNEELTLNVRKPSAMNLQIAAWDANLVTPHKRMGNASISLEGLCNGDLHVVLVELEGMGGGGRIELEVKYKSYSETDEKKKWWGSTFVSEFLLKNGFDAALKKIVGSESVQARQFVQYAFGQLKLFSDVNLQNVSEGGTFGELPNGNGDAASNSTYLLARQIGETTLSDKQFWKNLANVINQNVVLKLGLTVTEKIKWDGFELSNFIGLQSRSVEEAKYIEWGLATPEDQKNDDDTLATAPVDIGSIQSSFPDIKKATADILKQTDSILGALMVLAASVSQSNKEAWHVGKNKITKKKSTNVEDGIFGNFDNEAFSGPDGSILSVQKAEEMRALFSTAETAMEAWAMLATSMGHPTFIKSEFEKICFLDNPYTDTQVAIWRDTERKRLVIAFRGTEQAKWKDLRTDLMVAPVGLNPERIGGDFKQEVQVHSGFLSAYDSVRTRIMSLIKLSIGLKDDILETSSKWYVYVTGHSLGGALATLHALELSSSQLAKLGAISVSMYNFGSPRVGNKKFAEVYNQRVKDSWRVVNHRDIIPTVPHLMGYCHVAQPVYLAAGDPSNILENMKLLEDGYHGDLIGEYTPDVLVSEFMKGEKELIEKILQTEINIFRSIRDGTALMQHMEDFYYITLLEHVRLNYLDAATSQTDEESSGSIC